VNLTFQDHGHALAEEKGLLPVMSHVEDRKAQVAVQLPQELPELWFAMGIQGRGGFIQEQQLGSSKESLG
jgi:hypothetical protein